MFIPKFICITITSVIILLEMYLYNQCQMFLFYCSLLVFFPLFLWNSGFWYVENKIIPYTFILWKARPYLYPLQIKLFISALCNAFDHTYVHAIIIQMYCFLSKLDTFLFWWHYCHWVSRFIIFSPNRGLASIPTWRTGGPSSPFPSLILGEGDGPLSYAACPVDFCWLGYCGCFCAGEPDLHDAFPLPTCSGGAPCIFRPGGPFISASPWLILGSCGSLFFVRLPLFLSLPFSLNYHLIAVVKMISVFSSARARPL